MNIQTVNCLLYLITERISRQQHCFLPVFPHDADKHSTGNDFFKRSAPPLSLRESGFMHWKVHPCFRSVRRNGGKRKKQRIKDKKLYSQHRQERIQDK